MFNALSERCARAGKIPKRLIALLLAGVILLAVAPATASAIDICTVTINYYFEGSSIMLAEPYVVQVPSGEPYFRPSPPLDKFTLVDTNQGMVSGTATADRTINVYYRYAYDVVPYTVEYYQRNPSTLNYQLAQTETLYGRINETVNFRDKYFSGYYLVTEDPTLLITGDSPVKKLYYELTDMNYVIFRTGGSYIAPITAMAGANIADLAKARDKIHPTRQGYNFVRWDWEGHIPSTMPSQDLVVNAVWEPAQSKFNIIHWKQNTARNGYVIAENELVGGLTEATASSVGHTKNYPGFEFVHEDSGVVITADNTAVINFYYDRVMWSHDVYVKGVKVTTLSGYYGTPMTLPTEAQILAWGNYSATDYYAVGFRNESGTIVGYATPYVFGSAGTNRSDLVATEGDLTDTENTIFKKSKFPPHEIIITYYVETIDSPIANPDWQQTEVVRWVKFPAASMLVQVLHPPGLTAKSYNNGTSSYWAMGSATVGGQKVATFTSNGESGVRMRRNLYKLTYYNPFDGDKVEFPDQKFEKPIDLSRVPANIPADYEFVGWYASPDDFYLSPLTSKTIPDSDITLYAKLRRKHVTVTFNSNGGSFVPSQSVIGGESATRPADPTRDGYVFKGWFLDDGLSRWAFDRAVETSMTLHARWDRDRTARYTVQHVRADNGDTLLSETKTASVGETVYGKALESMDAGYPENVYLVPDYTTKSLNVGADSSSNVITFYYRDFTLRDYVVRYLRSDNYEVLRTEETFTTNKSIVTEFAPEIPSYEPTQEYKTETLGHSVNIITFYYTPTAALHPTVAITAADGGFAIIRGHWANEHTRTLSFYVRIGDSYDAAKVESELANFTLTAAPSYGFERVFANYTKIMDANLTLSAASIGGTVTLDGLTYREIKFTVTDTHNSGIVDFTLTYSANGTTSNAIYRVLIPGDILKVGDISAANYSMLYNYMRGSMNLPVNGAEGNYLFELADLNRDGEITVVDYTLEYNLMRGEIVI